QSRDVPRFQDPLLPSDWQPVGAQSGWQPSAGRMVPASALRDVVPAPALPDVVLASELPDVVLASVLPDVVLASVLPDVVLASVLPDVGKAVRACKGALPRTDSVRPQLLEPLNEVRHPRPHHASTPTWSALD